MDIFEISGFKSGIDKSGVNFLDPADAFEELRNGFVYRQQILSRKGFKQFGNRMPAAAQGNSRIMGIFENVLPDASRQLLVVDQNYMYIYNSGTNAFDLIPDGSSVPVYPFIIPSNESYVSGTTYLAADGTQRFVFTGKGMSDIYFYDGIDIKRFTNLADNLDYEAPSSGTLTNATAIIWFGERLNLFIPTINGVIQQQSVLFSAIRSVSGNGDKFNTAGAGTIIADTYEIMKGALILGDIIVMNFQRSNWVLEKTRDAFNPYLTRKVPSVLGTDAGFSAVSWGYQVKSLGVTGLITTDGRQSLRFDDLIYQFTGDDIDPETIELTYGGFDRIEGQFLFSYRSNGSTTVDTQDKVLVYNYEENTWAIFDQTFSVYGQTDGGQALTWDDIDETVDPQWAEWNTTEEIWNKIGIEAKTQKTLAGDQQGFVYQINEGYDDFFGEITSITQASPCVISMAAVPFSVGDEVFIKDVGGMIELNDQDYTILAVSATTITIDVDSTLFTAYTTAGSVSQYINFYAKTTVFNPYRKDGRKCELSHIEFLINNTSGKITVDIIEDEEETPFKTVLLDTDISSNKKREWITAIVNDEAEFFTLIFTSKTISNQKAIVAIRLHASPGSLTSG